jgi:hypothetical protein
MGGVGVRTAAVAIIVLSALVPSPALAQSSRDEQRARELFVEARAAFDDGRYPEARELLEESLGLAPRPASAMNLSRVLRSMGELLAAEASLEELLGGGFGLVEGERRAEATSLLSEVREELGTIAVSVAGALDAEVRIDGVMAGHASPGAAFEVRVDPGDHVVVASGDGARSERSLSVGPGERREIALEIDARDVDGDVDDGGSIFSSPWFWIITGVLIAGGVTTAVIVATEDRAADPVTDPVFPVAEVLLGP